MRANIEAPGFNRVAHGLHSIATTHESFILHNLISVYLLFVEQKNVVHVRVPPVAMHCFRIAGVEAIGPHNLSVHTRLPLCASLQCSTTS